MLCSPALASGRYALSSPASCLAPATRPAKPRRRAFLCVQKTEKRAPLTLSATQIDPGELTFCGQVSYTACLRYPVALEYDNTVSEAFMLRSDRLALEFPKASPLCVEAFQARNYGMSCSRALTRRCSRICARCPFPSACWTPVGLAALSSAQSATRTASPRSWHAAATPSWPQARVTRR